jgi:hypothetical protein
MTQYFQVERAVIWQLNRVISRAVSSSGTAVWISAQVRRGLHLWVGLSGIGHDFRSVNELQMNSRYLQSSYDQAMDSSGRECGDTVCNGS